MSNRKLWYIKRNNIVKGPFPTKVVVQHVVVGRYGKSDWVSLDTKQWHRIADMPELIPSALTANLNDPAAQDQLDVVKRWADERLSIDRRTVNGPTDHPDRRGVERRAGESVSAISHRELRTTNILAGRNVRRRQYLVMFSTLALAIAAVWWASGLEPKPIVEDADCTGAPVPDINWNSCQLAGSQLSSASLRAAKLRNTNLRASNLSLADLSASDLAYADLSLSNLTGINLQGANLVGVDFQRSVLAGANLDGADAAYANFFNTDLSNISLTGTTLDRAVWVNGIICADGSVGECILTNDMVR